MWSHYCVKSAQMQSFSWSVFSCIQSSIYMKILRIWTLFTHCDVICNKGQKCNVFNELINAAVRWISILIDQRRMRQWLEESHSKGKYSGLESSNKPGKLYMNTKRTLTNKNSVKTGVTIRLCQSRFISC